MQTFLPYPSFKQSAKCLDMKRLGKQRVEAMQIENCLLGISSGWKNHPAVKMWKGYLPALRQYRREMTLEWISRGYKNTMEIPEDNSKIVLPKWFGGKIHETHRSKLLQKDYDFYSQYEWKEEPDLEYYWPKE